MSLTSNLKFHRYFSHHIFLNSKEYKTSIVTLDANNKFISINAFIEETAMTLYIDKPITIINAKGGSLNVNIGDEVLIKY